MKIFGNKPNSIQYFENGEGPLQKPRENEIPEDIRAIDGADQEDSGFLNILLDADIETPLREAAEPLNAEVISLAEDSEDEASDVPCSEILSRELSAPRLLNSAPRKIAALIATGAFLSFAVMGVAFLFLSSDESSGSGLQGRVTANSSSAVASNEGAVAESVSVSFSLLGIIGYGFRNVNLQQIEHRSNNNIEKILRKIDLTRETFNTNESWVQQTSSVHDEAVVNIQSDLPDITPADSHDKNPSALDAQKLSSMPIVPFSDKFKEDNGVCPFEADAVSVESEQKIFGFEQPSMPLTLPFVPLNMSRYKVVSEALKPSIKQEESVSFNEQKVGAGKSVVDNTVSQNKEEPSQAESHKPLEKKITVPTSKKFSICDLDKLGQDLLPADVQKSWGKFLEKQIKEVSKQKTNKKSKKMQTSIEMPQKKIETLQKEGRAAFEEGRFPEWVKQQLPEKKEKKLKKK